MAASPPVVPDLRCAAGLIMVLIAVGSMRCRPADEGKSPAPGEVEAKAARLLPGPDFELLGLSGRLHRLSDSRGKVVVVNYWATWCTACRTEMPGLNHLYQELAEAGVEVFGIATDTEGAVRVRPYAEELGISYPILLDPEAVSATIFGGLEGYPKTFILDRQGLIYSSYLGAQDEEVFREDVVYLLEAPESPAAARSSPQ